MKELHIPYGLDRLSREIIEPEDAARGRACNCLCPGCEAPLLSRHPQREDVRIHFAHDSKHELAKPIEDCPLSPFVALGMMLRHIGTALTGKTIKLNAYCKPINFECCFAPRQSIFITENDEEALVTEAEHSVSLGGVTYDLRLAINGKSYFVELIYPGRDKKELPAPEHLTDIGGVFCISGPEFVEMMGKAEFGTTRYSEAVTQFLLLHSRKFWAHHFAEREKVAEFMGKHVCKPFLTNSKRSSSYRASPQAVNTYIPKYNTYSSERTPPQQASQPINLTRQQAAEAYLRGSTGDSSGRLTSNQPVEQSALAGYQEHERNYLMPTSYHAPERPLSGGPSTDESASAQAELYECVFCNIDFESEINTAPTCPRCRRHLGARPKK